MLNYEGTIETGSKYIILSIFENGCTENITFLKHPKLSFKMLSGKTLDYFNNGLLNHEELIEKYIVKKK